MKLKTLNDQVSEDLQWIPRGDLNQNLFRAAFNMARLSDLSEDPNTPVFNALEQAFRSVRKREPEFVPILEGPLKGLL